MKVNHVAAGCRPAVLCCAILVAGCVLSAAQQPASFSATHSGKNEFVIQRATLLTATHGRVENGSVYVKDGKIVALGETWTANASN